MCCCSCINLKVQATKNNCFKLFNFREGILTWFGMYSESLLLISWNDTVAYLCIYPSIFTCGKDPHNTGANTIVLTHISHVKSVFKFWRIVIHIQKFYIQSRWRWEPWEALERVEEKFKICIQLMYRFSWFKFPLVRF